MCDERKTYSEWLKDDIHNEERAERTEERENRKRTQMEKGGEKPGGRSSRIRKNG